MAGYTRNDTANNIADGNIINASDLDGEFDAVQSAFNASTGHTHDGTAGEGAPIEKVGPVQDLVITASEVKPKTTNTLDLGTSLLQYKDLYIEGSAYIDGLGESMLVDGASSIQFRDSALAINSSTDGQLDIIADTQLEITTPTVEFNTDGQILAFGADGEVTLTHVADTGLLINTNAQLQFRDSALKINSSADGQLDIDADTELELTAPIVDINASTSVNISNDLKLDSDSAILSLGADSEVTLTHLHNVGTELKVVNATTSSVTDILDLQVESSGTPAVGIGTGLTFSVETAGSNVELGGAVRAIATGLTPTAEEIDLVFYSMRNGSLTEAFRFDSINDSLSLADNVKATFGASDDLQIYHDGSHSYIDEQGTGSLQIRGTNLNLKSSTNETYLYCVENGEVGIQYDNALKLATTNTGIDVTGTVTADGLTVDSASGITVNGPTNQDGKLNLVAYAGVQDAEARIIAARGNTSGTDSRLKFYTNNGTSLVQRVDIDDNGDISFYEDTGTTAKFFWDASAERLGIGTTSPIKPLTIATANTATISGMALNHGASNYWGIGSYTDQSFRIAKSHGLEDENTYFTIERSTGNLGIGTQSPSDRLEVKGATSTGVIVISSGDTTITGNDVIGQLNFKDYDANAHVGGDQDDLVSIKAIALHESGGASALDGSTGEGYALSFSTSKRPNPNLAFTVSEAMRIDEDGNVGIGTSSPFSINGTNLEVSDALYARVILDSTAGTRYSIQSLNDSSLGIYDLDADTERMRIDSSGNVGIGTTDPSEQLEIFTSVNETPATLSLHSGDTSIAGTQEIGAIYGKGTDSGGSAPYTGAKITFAADGTWDTGTVYYYPTAIKFYTQEASGTDNIAAGPRMTIDSNGNVGLGVTPSAWWGSTKAIDISTYGAISQNSGGGGGVALYGNSYEDTSGTFKYKQNYYATLYRTYAGQHQFFTAPSGTAGNAITFTQAMTLDASGNLGIGTTSPDKQLHIESSTGGTIRLSSSDTTVGAGESLGEIDWYSNDGSGSGSGVRAFINVVENDGGLGRAYDMTFGTGNVATATEAMRIDSSGNLFLGGVTTGSYGSRITAQSTTSYILESRRTGTGSEGHIVFQNGNGAVGSIFTNASATAYNTSSDYRLKENIVDMTGAIDRVKALNPSQFNFIADPDRTVDGFLAHEVADVVPEAVTGTKDAMQTEEYEVTPAVLDDDGNVVTEAVMGTREVPDYQGIDQSKLVPLLTGALQEAIARIETLEAEVATLKGN